MSAVEPAKRRQGSGASTTPGAVVQESGALDRKLQRTRALVTSGCFLIGCLAYASGAVQGHAGKVLPAIALMPLSSWLLLAGIKGRQRRPALLTAISLAADTLLVSWIIAWTGGASSACLPFYLTPVMAASFRFGPWGSVACSLLCLAGYVLAGSAGPALPPAPAGTSGLILRILSLFAASGFGIGALHRKLERYRQEKTLRRELETANAQLARAYQDLQSTQEQLLHAEKLASIGTLVAGVAHEINNPISFVYGNLIHLESYVGRLKSLLRLDDGLVLCPDDRRRREAAKAEIEYDYLRQDLDQALADCREGAERVRKIVAVLLRYSRPRRGASRRVELSDLLDSALRLLSGKLTPKIRVVRDVASQAAVVGDPDELGQLFLNLLSNAADAVEGGGTITVRATAGEEDAGTDSILLEIEDTGPGVPPEHRHRIFEPFFTTKEVGKGTGLGLAIAYSIVKRHRGKIGVTSPSTGGARFRVSLPAWRDLRTHDPQPVPSDATVVTLSRDCLQDGANVISPPTIPSP